MHRRSDAVPYPLSPVLKPLLIILSTLALAGCEVIGDIFKAGFWTGIIIVAVVVAIAIFLVRILR